MSSFDDYKIDGVVYTKVPAPMMEFCNGCVGEYSQHLCDTLCNNCERSIWVVKDSKDTQEYIQKIQEKYPEENNKDSKKYNHYFKDVSNLKYIDIYRVISLWEVNDPCIQHAVKKLLVAGNRGYKDVEKDIQEAIDSLERWKEMRVEDNKEDL